MNQSQENLQTYERTDGQNLFYRTLPAETLPAKTRGPKILLKTAKLYKTNVF